MPIDRETPEKDTLQPHEDKEEQEMMENMSNLLITNDDIDLGEEVTINYSNDMSVSRLIDYYEEQQLSLSKIGYYTLFF